jgi:hypothetical protein
MLGSYTVMLNVVTMSIVMLSVLMFTVIKLSVVMLCAVNGECCCADCRGTVNAASWMVCRIRN